MVGYKYFQVENLKQITVKLRRSARGKLIVRTDPNGVAVGEIVVKANKDWQKFSGSVNVHPGKHALYLCFEGRGKLELLEITLGH